MATSCLEMIMFLPLQAAPVYSSFQNQGLSLKHHYTLQVLQKAGCSWFFWRSLATVIAHPEPLLLLTIQ